MTTLYAWQSASPFFSKTVGRVASFARILWERRTPIIIIAGLMLVSLLAIPRYLTPAHGAGYPGGPGLVCLADPSSAPAPPANPCPTAPYHFTGPPSTPQTAPTQIKIGVFINGSNSMSGFDITLKSGNTSVLVPTSFNITGTILSVSSVASPSGACINGIGGVCTVTDTYGTIHLVLFNPNTIIAPPVTGLLFTSTWNIVGDSPPSGTSITFQTGCLGTSVAPNVCVTVANGSLAPDNEVIQAGNTFSNSPPLNAPWIALTSPNSTSLTVGRGSPSLVIVSAVAENGWPAFSNDLVTFQSLITSGLTPPTLSVGSCSTVGTNCNTTASLNTSTAGVYVVYILGTYVTTDLNATTGLGTGLTDTLVGSIKFTVTVQDASISVSPTGNIYMFGTFQLTVTVQSIQGFVGTVTLSTGLLSPATGISFSYPASFSLAANSLVAKTVTVTSSTFNRYLYQMRLSAVGQSCGPSCTITHNSLTVPLFVTGFTLSLNTSTTPTPGNAPALVVSVKSLGITSALSFAGPVALASKSSPVGPTVSFNTTSVTLVSGGHKNVLVNFTSAVTGVFTVQIVGMGGTNGLMTNQTFALFFNLTDSLSGVRSTVSGATALFHTSGLFGASTYLNAVNMTTGAIYSKSANANIFFNTQGMGHFIDEISTSPYWLSTNCAVSASSGTASCFLSRTVDALHNGAVDISDYALVNGQFGQTVGSTTYDPRADLLAAGRVSILDISIEGLYFGCTVITP